MVPAELARCPPLDEAVSLKAFAGRLDARQAATTAALGNLAAPGSCAR